MNLQAVRVIVKRSRGPRLEGVREPAMMRLGKYIRRCSAATLEWSFIQVAATRFQMGKYEQLSHAHAA
jgi:hypothetical protein